MVCNLRFYLCSGLLTAVLALLTLGPVPSVSADCGFQGTTIDLWWTAPCELHIYVTGQQRGHAYDPDRIVRIILQDAGGDPVYTFPDETLPTHSDEFFHSFAVDKDYTKSPDDGVCKVTAQLFCGQDLRAQEEEYLSVAALCTDPPGAWDCLACSPQPGEIPGEALRIYKSSHILYAAGGEDSHITTGEIVNGEFIAPVDGALWVSVEGSSSQVDLYGGVGSGWHTPSGREGARIDPDACFELAAGVSFEFNVRAGKVDTSHSLKITFDWYWWNEVACCLEHDQKVQELQAKPMEVVLSKMDPLIAAVVCVHTKSDQSKEYELRVPMCPRCGRDGVCPPGNFSMNFIAWPSEAGKQIGDGHAKGWRIEQSGQEVILTEPGPDGRKYRFASDAN